MMNVRLGDVISVGENVTMPTTRIEVRTRSIVAVASMNGIDVIVCPYSDDGKSTGEDATEWDCKGLCAFLTGHPPTPHTDADHVHL